jgi:prepilin-type N-terminal cleavage/methylation domain-containing protein
MYHKHETKRLEVNMKRTYGFIANPATQAAQRSKGFSLIELMVVIGIIGIVMLIAIPNFVKSQQAARIRAGAQEVAQDFRQIRERAISQNRRYTVKPVPAQSRQYQVTDPLGTTTVYRLGSTTGGNLRFGCSAVPGSLPPEANGAVPASGFDFDGDSLLFEPRGSASQGVAYITDGKRDYAIGVTPLGKVRVYYYAGGSWSPL